MAEHNATVGLVLFARGNLPGNVLALLQLHPWLREKGAQHGDV